MSNLKYIRELGSGAFGSVWLAKDLGTSALRAVKLVSPSSIPSFEAYNEEARVLNELKHPNIITVYGTELGPESGTTPDVGKYAIVMEYMEGGSLEDSLASGDLLLIDAVHRLTEACRGAEHVHANGYVHRDIKPANVLVAGSDTKLSDFGLVQPLAHGLGSGAGTPYYVAPEVIESGITSSRSDIYSLGVTLYEVINGSDYLRWNGSSDDFARAVVRGEFPHRSECAPFVTPALQRVIKKALHPDPLKRYASVADFRHALALVPIACSWRREAVALETWLGMGLSGLFRVSLDVTSGMMEVSRCKVAPGAFRKVTVDCLYRATGKELRKHQRVVMQRITADGR